MKLLSYKVGRDLRFGAIQDQGLVDLAARMLGYSSLRQVIAENALDLARSIAEESEPDTSLNEITYLPPVPDAERIFCVGVNYGNRHQEYRDGSQAPRYPSLFMRTRESLVGHLEPILRPPESDQLDYEGEVVMIVGKPGRRIPEDRAHEHIAGLTLMNEGSIRDYIRHGKFNVTQGKNFEASGSVGPAMVTMDEISSLSDLDISTRVNGELRQQDSTANLMFPFEQLIAYISAFAHLKPGDLISTGTPTGAGARFDPPRYLKPGDVVEVASSAIGVLKNQVEDEQIG